MTTQSDNIFAQPLDKVDDFTFDDAVADVFPDMIERSVPGYQTIIQTIGKIANRCVKPNTNVYDLGCSLGAASLSVARNTSDTPCHIIGVDSSRAMTQRCQRIVSAFHLSNPIDIRCAKAQDIEVQNASMIVMNFTLQFIPPQDRLALLKKLYQGLVPGGVLVLSEKISHPDNTANELLIDLHLDFKRDNGYSELEISQKRAALENVMLIDSYQQHEARLHKAGFDTVSQWCQNYNFMSLFAIKAE